MVTKNKDGTQVKTIDALRLKKYYSCYINQFRVGPFEKFVANAAAPIEHMFGNHSFCHKS